MLRFVIGRDFGRRVFHGSWSTAGLTPEYQPLPVALHLRLKVGISRRVKVTKSTKFACISTAIIQNACQTPTESQNVTSASSLFLIKVIVN